MINQSSLHPWIFMARPNLQSRLRLFCFAHAGGTASMYRPWLDALSPAVEVFPVQLPGHENRLREQPLQQFDQLIRELAQALRPLFTKPFAFFGHSMGALISYGLTCYLRDQKSVLPTHLLVSAYRAPQLPNPEALHLLPDAELVQKLLSLNGTKPEVLENPELRNIFLPLFRADFAICESYRYRNEEPLPCPISAFGGLQDPRVKSVALGAWRERTSDRFTLQMLSGGHFYLQEQDTPLLSLISHELNV